MTQALYISALGMALVFIGLLLLWWMMALLVRITQSKTKPVEAAPSDIEPAGTDAEIDQKLRAVSAAVAAAITMANASLMSTQTREKEGLSPWQAAHRHLQISQNPARPARKE